MLTKISKLGLVMATILLLPFSCTKEEFTPHPLESLTENEYASVRDDGGDCHYELRINSITGAGVYDPQDPPPLWGFVDITNPTIGDLDVSGSGDYYFNTNTSQYEALPSIFYDLDDPSDGNHDFMLISEVQDPENVVLYAEVRCYDVDNGVETLATTTYHQFAYDDGTAVLGFQAVTFCRNFSCEVLAAGEDECR